MTSIGDMRHEYGERRLAASDAGVDPIERLRDWLLAAVDDGDDGEPNAMAFATAAPDGTPSVRMVLVKDIDPASCSVVVYTGLESRKGREALASGRGAGAMWWPRASRQARIVGRVEQVDRAEAEAYFASRPRASRIGANASQQSRPIASREVLEDGVRRADGDEMPATWGGLRLVIEELELWQGRPGRLHDRILFLRTGPDGRALSRAAIESLGGDDAAATAATAVVDHHGRAWLRMRLAP